VSPRWAAALLLLAAPVQAQERVEAAAGEDIVVTARRSGAPMWEVRSGDTTLILVGDLAAVPKTTPWRPEQLEAATRGADAVILGARTSVSVGDVFRLIFKGGRLTKLPDKRTIADYLSADEQARLVRLYEPGDDSFERRNLLLTAFNLLTRKLRFNRDTADDAGDVVRRAAKRADKRTRPVGTVKGGELLDSLFAAAPETHKPCLMAAIAAAEAGPEVVERRGRAWIERDVPAVLASPVERALARCWPWSDNQLGQDLRGQWITALDEALVRPGTTLAVVPIRVLAEPNGLLDALSGRGLRVTGPEWCAVATQPGR
jgi:uncharacterized protein YbaP (TraB family)